MIWERYYRTCQRPLLRLFWYLQWRKVQRYERQACARFDGIVAVSELDKQVLERDYGARNVHAVPTGVDTDFFRPHPEPPEENNLVFLGAMDWLPNEDGILFFADEVLPRLRKLVPTAHITVVGRNPSPKLLKRTRVHPEIRVVGRVEDVRRHVARGALFVIPSASAAARASRPTRPWPWARRWCRPESGWRACPSGTATTWSSPTSRRTSRTRWPASSSDRAERDRIGHNARAYIEDNVSWRRAASAFADICMGVARA